MAATLSLTTDELLTTTRTVRKRLDLTRPVEREVIEECITLAQQAPIGGNLQNWHVVVVTDPAKKAALAEIYRKGWDAYRVLPYSIINLEFEEPARQASQHRSGDSAQYLADHLHEVPVLVVVCVEGRLENQNSLYQSAVWGSVAPATWSFMLAARARGLGTAWTSVHLAFEQEAAEVLGIPYDQVTQTSLIPVAYTHGTDFKPALRDPMGDKLHWEQW